MKVLLSATDHRKPLLQLRHRLCPLYYTSLSLSDNVNFPTSVTLIYTHTVVALTNSGIQLMNYYLTLEQKRH